jgi:hypothetical protein
MDLTHVQLDEFIPGRPAPFATSGERAWKDAIALSLASVEPDARGVFLDLHFGVAPAIGYAEGADLDNLCEPVFSVLANRLGWFGGRRPNVRAFRARKALVEPTGCRIRITESRWAETSLEGDVLLDGVYVDEMPRSARDETLAAWVSRTMSRPARSAGGLTIVLGFAGPVNLGDIATGRLKNVMDCLYPLIGGRQGAPNDSRITSIEATRMESGVAAGVRVRVIEGPN